MKYNSKIIVFLIILVSNVYTNEECGIRLVDDITDVSSQWRVVGGHDAKPHSWPWMVSIQMKSVPFFKVCGGTLISSEWVLSAAHCFEVDDNPNVWSVRLGNYNSDVRESFEVEVAVEELHMHRKFSREHGVFNDIALIKLNETLDLSEQNKNFTPICIPQHTEKVTECVVIGWGYPKPKTESTAILQEASVPIVNSSVCFDTFKFRVDVKTAICAGGLTDGGLGVCNGDSGGPLQCRYGDGKWYQIGIVSWGIACAKPGIPDIYTKVSAYYDWIYGIISSNDTTII